MSLTTGLLFKMFLFITIPGMPQTERTCTHKTLRCSLPRHRWWRQDGWFPRNDSLQDANAAAGWSSWIANRPRIT